METDLGYPMELTGCQQALVPPHSASLNKTAIGCLAEETRHALSTMSLFRMLSVDTLTKDTDVYSQCVSSSGEKISGFNKAHVKDQFGCSSPESFPLQGSQYTFRSTRKLSSFIWLVQKESEQSGKCHRACMKQ